MTNRVLIDSGKLRVSLPGYDVFTAKLDELAFDSSFSSIRAKETGTIALTGMVAYQTFPDKQAPYRWAVAAGSGSVYFSRSYSVPPAIIAGVYRPGGYIQMYSPTLVGPSSLSIYNNTLFAQVTTTGINFRNGITGPGVGGGPYYSGGFEYWLHLIHWAALV